MITLIEALRFRCLRTISQGMGGVRVLVGPNGSGKTTFFDVVSFLGRLVSGGIDNAIGHRTANFYDLLWQRSGQDFELAIELRIPDELRRQIAESSYDTVRYQVRLAMDEESNQVVLDAETVLLKQGQEARRTTQGELFPRTQIEPDTILEPIGSRGVKTVINKAPGGNDNFYSERDKGWVPAFKLGPRRSALSNLPEDESRWPVATWLKEFLTEGIQELVLNSLLIRKASPPGRTRTFQPDGSNLPWVISDLESRGPERIRDWVHHLRTALPDLEGIRTVERPDDRHRYLMLQYQGGLEVPSWMASDGTLRLLALTLPAYLPGLRGIYLIEEPENGIHPRAVETMFQSLSSVYDAQILLATHSPVILGLVDPSNLLCLAKDKLGATDIVLGSEHPALQEWRGETNLATLYAAGVLG